MIMDEVQLPDLKTCEDQIKQSRKIVEDMEYQVGFLSREGQLGEESLIRNLKDLHQSFKNTLTVSQELRSGLEDKKFARTPVELASARDIKTEQDIDMSHEDLEQANPNGSNAEA